MSVVFDNATSISGTNVSTLTTPPFIITNQLNRIAIFAFENDNDPVITAGPTVAGAGVIGVPGCFNVTRFHTWYQIAPASGSQTASITWTSTAPNCTIAVATFYGVDQNNPIKNGLTSGLVSAGPPNSSSITIDGGNPGDLSVDHTYTDHGAASAPTQTLRWTEQAGGGTNGAGTNGSTGLGNGGMVTHGWTISGSAGREYIADGFTLRAAASPTGAGGM